MNFVATNEACLYLYSSSARRNGLHGSVPKISQNLIAWICCDAIRQCRARASSTVSAQVGVGTESCPRFTDEEHTVVEQVFTSPKCKSSKPPHNLTTSPELLRRRQEKHAAAQALTRSLVTCRSVAEARALYDSQSEQFNAIHFAALFTALGRLGTAAADAVPYSQREPLPTSQLTQIDVTCATTTAAPVVMHSGASSLTASSRSERAAARDFVLHQLMPHLELRLTGLGTRQLATVLAVMAHLDCPPPVFWMSEWLQHFARRVVPMPNPSLIAFESSTVVAAAAANTSSEDASCRCTTTDIARAMWALARLRTRRRRGALISFREHGTDSSSTALSTASTGEGRTAKHILHAHSSSDPNRSKGSETASGFRYSSESALKEIRINTSPDRGDGGPSSVWLQTVSYAFGAQAGKASPADIASYLWAVARLDYRPSVEVMHAVLTRCGQLMKCGSYCHHAGTRGSRCDCAADDPAGGSVANGTVAADNSFLRPRELCVVLWALAFVGFFPGQAWLHRAGTALVRMAGPPAPNPAGVAEADVRPAATGSASPLLAVPVSSTSAAAALPGVCMGSTTDWWTHHLSSPSAVMVVASSGKGDVISENNAALLDSRQAATCAWALARLGYHPSERILTTLFQRACLATRAAAGATASAAAPQDLSMVSFALGVLRFRPDSNQVLVMLSSMAKHLCDASPQDLVVWAAALARMRLAVPDPWFDAYLRRAAGELEALPSLALVNWLDAVARLRTARPLRRGRLELELTRRTQGASSVQQHTNADDTGRALDCAIAVAPMAGCAWTQKLSSPCAELSCGADSDPWIVVALPKAKPSCAAAACAAARKKRQSRRSRFRNHQLQLYPDEDGSADRPSKSCRHGPLMPAASAKASAAAATAANASRAQQARAVPVAKTAPIFIRPAARHLQQQRLLPRLLRLTAKRLPQLGLEQHCRLAWAVANLHMPVHRSWIDALMAQTSEALEQRFRLQQAEHRGGDGVGASGHLMSHGTSAPGTGASFLQAQVPVVNVRWILKLVRAVQMLVRGPRGGDGGFQRGRLRQRLRFQHRHAPGIAATAGSANVSTDMSALQQIEDQLAPPDQPLTNAATLHSYVPRRWRVLMLMAVLPQLSALTNAQLLRFVRALARLRGTTDTIDCYDDHGNSFPLIGGRGLQRRLASELGSYCRRRVEATCGGAEACDLTTSELLRWTRGWERRGTGGDGAGAGAESVVATAV